MNRLIGLFLSVLLVAGCSMLSPVELPKGAEIEKVEEKGQKLDQYTQTLSRNDIVLIAKHDKEDRDFPYSLIIGKPSDEFLKVDSIEFHKGVDMIGRHGRYHDKGVHGFILYFRTIEKLDSLALYYPLATIYLDGWGYEIDITYSEWYKIINFLKGE